MMIYEHIKVLIVGIKHRRETTIKKLTDMISFVKNEKSIFLLEYDEERYKISQKKKLSEREKDEFYVLSNMLQKLDIKFRYIDSKALELRRRFIENSTLKEVISFALKKYELSLLKKKKNAFYNLFIEEREREMVKEILKSIKENKYNKFIIVVGRDHCRNICLRLKKKLKEKIDLKLI